MRLVRYLWRVPLLLLHLLLAVPVAWMVQSDWAARRKRDDEPLNAYLVRWWTRMHAAHHRYPAAERG